MDMGNELERVMEKTPIIPKHKAQDLLLQSGNRGLTNGGSHHQALEGGLSGLCVRWQPSHGFVSSSKPGSAFFKESV